MLKPRGRKYLFAPAIICQVYLLGDSAPANHLVLLIYLSKLNVCMYVKCLPKLDHLFLGRPEQPFRTGLCFTRDVFFSPRFLRDPLTDRHETLPRDQNLAVFYKLTSKILGVLPPKKLGAKNMQNFGEFWTTSDFDRKYLRNGSRYQKLES